MLKRLKELKALFAFTVEVRMSVTVPWLASVVAVRPSGTMAAEPACAAAIIMRGLRKH